jgi:hypothetical protein
MFSQIVRRTAVLTTAAAFALGAVACSDDPAAPDDEPQVNAVRLTIGTTSITVSTVSSPTITVAPGANAVTAQWLRADGSVEPLVTDAEFELRIRQATGSNLSWTASGARAGTLTVTGLAAGASTAAQVSLFHKVEQHDDFGPLTFSVRVP